MKTITKEELKEILRLHSLWLEDKEKGVRANLSETDLSWANLRGADLSGAGFSGANLSGAILRGANFSKADLSRASFSRADLRGAILRGANLKHSIWDNARDLPFPIYNFSLSKDLAVATPSYLAVGCEQHDWKTWLSTFEEIGIEHGYSSGEIENYGKVIKVYAEILGVNKNNA